MIFYEALYLNMEGQKPINDNIDKPICRAAFNDFTYPCGCHSLAVL